MPHAPKDAAYVRYAKEWLGRLELVLRELGLKKSHLEQPLGIGQSSISQWWLRHSLPAGYYALRIPHAIFELTGTWVNNHWLTTGMGNPYYRAEERESATEGYVRGGLSAVARVENTLVQVRRELLAVPSPGAESEPGPAPVRGDEPVRQPDRRPRQPPKKAPPAPRRRKGRR